MRKVILYAGMSLDGYIADKNGKVGWLSGDGSDKDNPGSYGSFFNSVHTIVMGFKTYHQIVTELSPKEWVYPGKECFVFTHDRQKEAGEVQFTDKDPAELVKQLKEEPGGDIWVCGGSDIINQLIEGGCIDRYCITVIPTILGGGIPLFTSHGREIQLTLISTYSYNGMTDLVYEHRR